MHTNRVWRFAVLASVVTALFAADVTGTWTAQMPSRRRNPMDPRPATEQGRGGGAAPAIATFVLKAEGNKLTGTAAIPGGRGGRAEKAEIEDGKVDGDNISFTIGASTGRENSIKGKVTGDIIEFEMTSVMDDYGTPPTTFTAKRAR